MNFVVYCHIFQHICILFNVISMFYIDFWGFSNDPLYLGYNSAEQENPVLCIFNFQGPSWTQKDLGFFEKHFFGNTRSWSTWTTWGGQVAWPTPLAALPVWSWPSDLRLPRSSCHHLHFDLKTSINKAPSRSREEAEHKNRNTETEAEPKKIGGGNAAGAIPGCISILSNIIINISMMKRE